MKRMLLVAALLASGMMASFALPSTAEARPRAYVNVNRGGYGRVNVNTRYYARPARVYSRGYYYGSPYARGYYPYGYGNYGYRGYSNYGYRGYGYPYGYGGAGGVYFGGPRGGVMFGF